MQRKTWILAALFLLLQMLPAYADTGWQPYGLGSVDVRLLAVAQNDSRIVYASTGKAVVKSTDAGASWIGVSTGLPSSGIASLAVDPGNSETIYVGTYDSGLYKSTNGGESWSQLAGWQGSSVYALAIDHNSTQTVYAACSDGVAKSTDGGASWSSSAEGLVHTVFSLALDPGDSQTVYAGTADGVSKSGDGGQSWTAASTGLAGGQSVNALAIDPTNTQVLYAATGGGVYKSTNGGGLWAVSTTFPHAYSVAIDPSNSETIYAGGTGTLGLLKSQDGGATWNRVNETLPDAYCWALAVAPGSGQAIFAGTSSGVFRSSDDGTSWTSVNRAFPDYSDVQALAFDPGDSRTIYAGTAAAGRGAGGGFKSTNGGEYWSRMQGAVGDIRSLALDPKDSQTIFAATSTFGVLKGTVGGRFWELNQESEPDPEVYSVVVDPTNDQTVYAGTPNGLYRSTSGGEAWDVVLPETATLCVAIAPASSQTVYAGTWEGGYKSSDGGSSWTALQLAGPVFSLAVVPGSGQTVYAGTSAGILRSTDGGNSWSAINGTLPPPPPDLQFPDRYVSALVIDPTDSQTIYAATWFGVYVSNDGGGSWSRMSDGLPQLPVRTLAIDPSGQILLAGTAGGGAFRFPLLPKITGTPTTSVTAGDTYSFTPKASNTTGFSITSRPSWASFDDKTGTLTGTPSNADAGTYSDIVISASNSAATVPLPAFSITVLALLPPTISGTPAATVVAGHPYNFTPTATSATGFTIGNQPAWASFDTTSGALTGTPTEAVVGSSSSIEICAVNRTGPVCLPKFGITVLAPPKPTISGTPAASVTAGYSYRFTPTATDATRFSISTLPAWASFDINTGTLSGTPSQGGTYSNIVISASNNTGIATLAAFSITVRPAVVTWQPTGGPEGGLVQFVTIDPADSRNLYAGVFHGGMFKSGNAGESWTSINNADVTTMAIDPSSSQVVYAGTDASGIYKSTDGGATWTPINNGLTGNNLSSPLAVSSLAIDPVSTQTIYAAVSPGGVFKSSNGGQSWSAKNIGFANQPTPQVRALLIDGSNSLTVYAVADGQLFKSINAGEGWSAAVNGLGDTIVNCVARAPKTGTVYIGTAGGVFKSSDGGASWGTANGGLTGNVYSLAIDSEDNLTLYAVSGGSVFKSSDGGDSWRAASTRRNMAHVISVTVDRANSQTVYVATDGGVYKSGNGGDSWSTINHQMVRTNVYRMAVADSQTIYAGTDGGLFKSTDGGNAWNSVNDGMPAATAYTVALDPGDSQIVYASSGGSLFKSTDGGASWSGSGQGLENAIVYELTVDSRNLYAVSGGHGIFKSGNGGGSWTPINNGLESQSVSTPVAVDSGDNQTIYAGTWGGGMFKSRNGGGSWSAINSGLSNQFVRCLAIDPNNSRIIYAGTALANGIFKSTDGGGSWSAVNDGLPSFAEALAIDPISSRTIYAATDAGVFRSTDGGTSWSSLGTGLPHGKMIVSLAIAPGSSHPIFAGTEGHGVFKTAVDPLTIAGTPATSVTAGQRYSFTPSATGASGFSITYKPSWAAFDTATGALTGTPTNVNATTFSGIAIRASNGTDTVALPAFSLTVKAETTLPVVNTFTVTTPVNSLTVPISITASDGNNDITGYQVTTSSSAPGASALGWSPSAPTSYSFTSTGIRTLYAWAKDAAGNVSAYKSAVVNIDLTKPVITSFVARPAVNSGTIPITVFTASDNTAVTGYQISESSEPGSSDWKPTPPGTYLTAKGNGETVTLYAWVRDGAGNISLPATAKSTIDTDAPVITEFTAPSLTNSLSFPIKVASNDKDVAGYLITTTNEAPTSGSWTQPTSFTAPSSGIWTLYAWAKDTAGNVSRAATATINVDRTAPAIADFSLGDTTREFTVPVTLSATDSTGVTGYQITTSTTAPVSWRATPPTSYTFTSAGTKTLYAWAKDAIGNVSAAKKATVIIDLTPPYISSFAVKTAWNTRSVPVTAFSASDNTAVTGYLITETSSAPPASAGWTPTPPATYAVGSSGPFTLYAWTRDAAGNVSGYRSATTTIDEQPPTITFTAPALTGNLTFPITVLATDNVKVTGYLVTTASTPPAGALWSTSLPLTYRSSSSGLKTLYAFARDAAGNVSSATATVNIDTTAPVVKNFSLGGPTSNLTVPVTLDASDGTGVTGYQITTSSTAPLSGGTGWSPDPPTSYTFTTTGSKTLYAWAKDAAGNVSSKTSASVTIDRLPPYTSAFTVPTYSKSRDITVSSFSVSDNVGVTGYKITESLTPAPSASSGGWQTKAPTSYHTDSTDLVTLYAWAKDAAGNVSVSRQAVTTVDIEPPKVTLTAPAASKGTIYLKVAATDNIKVTGYLVTLSTTAPTATSSWSLTPPTSIGSSTSGTKTVYAYARDAAGNISGTSAKVTVDTTTPTISVFSLTAQQNSLTAAVHLTASDTTGVSYQITTNSTAPAASGGGWSDTAPTTYTFPSAGTKTLYVWVKDGAGNLSYKRATVTIPLP